MAAVSYQDCDGFSTTECISRDCFGEVREVDLAELKQEQADDVCCVLFHISSLHQREFMQVVGLLATVF